MKILKKPEIAQKRNNSGIKLLYVAVSAFFFSLSVIGQAQSYIYKYWIRFYDKKYSSYSIDHPEQFLSQRSIQRRINQNINLDSTDLPVSHSYIDSLTVAGIHSLYRVKWFNGVTIELGDTSIIQSLRKKTFISDVKKIYTNLLQKSATSKFNFNEDAADTFNFNYGLSEPTIGLVNGKYLHEMGFIGNGILIALLDAGFYRADILPAFNHLWQNDQIIAIRDFVNPTSDVFLENAHGMFVLSIVAGYFPGQQIGTAPGASFALIRTEDVNSEFIVEEYNWAAGAEFADSIGTDIITTSLGYFQFDDSTQNHTYSDLNGHSTFVTKAAEMAFKKGILVVASAGNEGNTPWKYIIAPADGDNVIAVGAIDRDAKIAVYSSHGPRIDGAVKPNVVALGKDITIQHIDSSFYPPSYGGTSFSAPVISGMAACLWQSAPGLKNSDIFKAILQSTNHFYNPDTLTGYGIPDFYKAMAMITNFRQYSDTGKIKIIEFPNPFADQINIELINLKTIPGKAGVQTINCDIYNLAGEKIWSGQYIVNVFDFNFIKITSLFYLKTGIYLLVVRSDNSITNIKICKQ